MTTIINPNGLLAYGDNDGSVIWRSPLTSEAIIQTPEIGGAATFTKVGTGHVFDPVNGFLPNATSYYRTTNTNNNADLTFGFQCTFQVKTAMLACSGAQSEGSSGGTSQTAQEMIVGMTDSPATNTNHTWSVSVLNKILYLSAGYGSNTAFSGVYISDVIGKEEFTTLHVACNCNTFYLFVNGVLVTTLQKAVNFPTYYCLYIGGGPVYWSPTQPLTTSYVRRLQIASRRPMFAVHPVLSQWQVIGDSYADTKSTCASPAYDTEKLLVMNADLASSGFKPGGVSIQSYGGRKIIGSGDPAVYLIDNVATALADKPTSPVFQAGANDVTLNGTMDVAGFTSGMHAIIEQYFGVNGNPATTTQKMVICSTPWAPNYPDAATSSGRKADIASINTIQAGLPAWWDATYPALAGRVKYFDMLTHFGGFNPDPTLFSVSDLLHPSPKGRYVMGKGWALATRLLMR